MKVTGTDQIREVFRHYCAVADLLGEMFGGSLEAVVHDLRGSKGKIIHIVNAHVTGRKIGDRTTDLGERRMREDTPDLLAGYENRAPDGTRLKSSSLAIRNAKGGLIGSLCLNLQLTAFDHLSEQLRALTATNSYPAAPEAERFHYESLSAGVEEDIEAYILSKGLLGRSWSNAAKRGIVVELANQGLFQKKGAVTAIAKRLQLTRPTVYKYLRELSREST